MEEYQELLKKVISVEHAESAIRVGMLVLVMLPLCFLLANWLRRLVTRRFTAQQGLVAGKFVRYSSVIVVTLLVFNELGFSLAPLLGAAGIVGVALAFASQTSVSNIISGLFLIAERPFEIGDAITVGTTTGIVLSIDTLSVKLRTLDNRFVRLPNELILKNEVINITRFPIRRLDLNIGVAYDADLALVRKTLLEVAEKNPLSLMEPNPLLLFTEFADSSVNILFGVWVVQNKFVPLKNSIIEEIKIAFDENGIEIPFPQRTVWVRDSDADQLTKQQG